MRALLRRVGLAALLAMALAGCRGGPPSHLASVDEEEALATYGFALTLRGNASFDEEDLAEVIRAQLDDYAAQELRPAFVDDAAYVLENHYRAQGFPFAAVTYDVAVTLRGNRVLLEIEEGPRVAMGALEITGLRAVVHDDARAFFVFPEEDDRRFYSERSVRTGVSALTDHYLGRGYLDVAIAVTGTRFSEDRTRATVEVAVSEGPRYVVRGILIEGIPEAESARVGPVVERALGRPFTPRLAFELRNRILEWYGDRGYAEAGVELDRDIDDQTGDVLLRYRVERGPRIRIARVDVEGNDKTRGSVVRSALEQERGDVFRRESMRDSFRRLYQTGLFERVSLGLEPVEGSGGLELAEGEEARALAVDLEELPSQEVFIEPGYGSYEQLRLRVGYRERNLFGTGRGFRAEATAALRALRAEVGLSDPSFLFDEVRADLAVRAAEREEPSFTRREVGVTQSFTWPLWSQFENTVAYQYRRSSITDIEVVDELLLEEQESVDISSVRVTPRFDTRNDLFVPSEGWLVRAGVEFGDEAIGSELDFMRLSAAISHYIALDGDGDTVLALAAESGVIVPRGGSDVIPLQERFFLGGEGNVRSFTESDLGPKDAEDNPIGGEAFTFTSVELRQRLAGKFQGAVFFDAGSVLLDYNEWSEFDDFEYGVGVGLRYVLPVGPLRVDVGWNPEAEGEQDDFVVHFALGMSF